jgi:hypothetical protein
MDTVVKFLLDHIPDPRVFPSFILVFGWLIWSILKVCQWPRPRLSTMLMYTASVAIAFDLQLPMMRVCSAFIDRCSFHSPPWHRFFSDVVFWFVVIYVVMKLISRINLSHSNLQEK